MPISHDKHSLVVKPELKFQRSLNNREYPQLDPPHPQIFESSNSSNNFNGLPLTPGIVMEDVNSPNTPQTPHLHKQGILLFFVTIISMSAMHGTHKKHITYNL